MENQLSKHRVRLTRERTHIARLKNGATLTTIPKWLAEKLDINKNTLLKWSYAGSDRILIEIIKEG